MRRILLIAFILISLSTANFFGQKPGSDIELISIYDAFGKSLPGTVQDFGFSTLIRYRGKTILFDAGTNVRRLQANVKALRIDLKKVDIAIVSHSHYDHIGGFDALLAVNPKVKIYLPNDFIGLGAPSRFPFRDRDPDAASTLSSDEKYFRGERGTDGMLATPSGRFWSSDFEFVNSAKQVLPGLTLVPTTSTLLGTFSKYPPNESSPMLTGIPELSAVFSTSDGDVLVSGCSHSGIENIVRASRAVGGERTRLVVGGFHMIPYDRSQITSFATRLNKDLGVDGVAPAHCTGHLGFVVLKEIFGQGYRFFGLGEKIVLPAVRK